MITNDRKHLSSLLFLFLLSSGLCPASLLSSSAFAEYTVPPENHFNAATGTPIASTTPQAIATAISGTRRYIGSWTVGNAHATVGTLVDLYSGSTLLDTCPAAPAYGGCVKTYPNNSELRSGSNEAINCTARTTGATVSCSVAGYLSLK